MTALLVWAQIAQGIPETRLNMIIEAFAGLAILWVLRTVLKNDKKTDAISRAIYGDEHAKEPSGLLHSAAVVTERMEKMVRDFDVHVQAEGEWQERMATNISRNNDNTHDALHRLERRVSDGGGRRK